LKKATALVSYPPKIVADVSAKKSGGCIRQKEWRMFPPKRVADVSAKKSGGCFRQKERGMFPPKRVADVSTKRSGEMQTPAKNSGGH